MARFAETRKCNLAAEFGPAFQAEYERMSGELAAHVSGLAEAAKARAQIVDIGAGLLATMFGPFATLFAEGLNTNEDMRMGEDRAEALRLFHERIGELCQLYQGMQLDAAEQLRWEWVRETSSDAPSWPEWQAMTEAERAKWSSVDTEPIEVLRMRVADRQGRLEQAKVALAQLDGILVTTTGRIVRGPFRRV